jgi:hypothetical protein
MKTKNDNEYSEFFINRFTGIIESCDGSRYAEYGVRHFKNGTYHRENGPAVEWADGEKRWYLNGEYFYTKDKFKIAVENVKKNRIF